MYADAGGALGLARRFAHAAADAGADDLLLLPPYLVDSPAAGLVAYTRGRATPLRWTSSREQSADLA